MNLQIVRSPESGVIYESISFLLLDSYDRFQDYRNSLRKIEDFISDNGMTIHSGRNRKLVCKATGYGIVKKFVEREIYYAISKGNNRVGPAPRHSATEENYAELFTLYSATAKSWRALSASFNNTFESILENHESFSTPDLKNLAWSLSNESSSKYLSFRDLTIRLFVSYKRKAKKRMKARLQK